ncbi:MAG: hypothetical protein V2I36_14970 [Desulfopila sp.]|jgi:hypothetical protein|nr:hypothetical protein [Desulfopila sp.]
MENETALLLRRNYSKIFILFGCDFILLFVQMVVSPSYLIDWLSIVTHCFFVAWIGLLLHWISKVKNLESGPALALYWVASFLSILASLLLLPVLWIISAYIMKKGHGDGRATLENSDAAETLKNENGQSVSTGSVPGSIWPLYAAVVFAVGALAQTVLMFGFDPGEFGALGMFFIIGFTTPFFLLIPGLLRVPAAKEIKRTVVLAQYFVYFLILFSWVVFIARSSL